MAVSQTADEINISQFDWIDVMLFCWFADHLAHPGLESRSAAIFSADVSYLFIYNPCETNYLRIYGIDPCQIFRAGRTMAVDCQSAIYFSYVTMETIFVVVHGCHWMQAASGAARWANVGHCPAYNFVKY